MDENQTPETTLEETTEVTSTSTEVTTLQYSESTTTIANLSQDIDIEALNRFTLTAYVFMSAVFLYAVIKGFYKLLNIFF